MLNLARCGELLASVGGALHPGLRLAPPPQWLEGRPIDNQVRVLFLCTGNSARSPMAEALTRDLSQGALEVFSAGSHPKPLHRNAVRVMAERGIDLSGRGSRHLDEFADRHFDYLVSVCDRVREVCPPFPSHPHLIHWSIPDPSQEGSTDHETYPAFQHTANDLAARIPFLLRLIAASTEEVI